MKPFHIGVCTPDGWGIDIIVKMTEGAGFGNILYLQLPKLYLSFLFLVFVMQITIGDIREERDAAIKAIGGSER